MPAWQGTVARSRGSLRIRAGDAVPVVVLAAVTVVLFLTAPRHGDFWWSDVSRHALDGVFVHDLLATLPLDPVEWAQQYYLRYPALTILFYPPLFYLLSAPFFAVLGVSHAAALVPVMLGYFAFGCGSYAVLLRWVGRASALAGALLLMGAPIVALWGRQVMLELPCLAFLIWGVWLLLRYADRGAPRDLYGAAALVLCALYTKQTVVFMAVPLAMLVLAARPRALRDRHVWITAALLGVGLIPLAWLTWKFGSANVQSVAGVDDSVVSRASLAGWLWYLRGLPEQLGWPTVLLAVAGLAGAARWRSWRLPARDAWFLALWFVAGYLLFSAIDLKDLRFSMAILFPVVVAAVLPLDRLTGGDAAIRAIGPVAIGALALASSLVEHPVPRIAGYREAVDLIADRAPPDS
ncbi:MAG: glycosyltransferase family 39 protein, partial [Alphaproteobacteria bacterium]|nr:glycosyltransferase family 39 protein [Alphaproteobacteria bacterium]